MWEPLRHLDGYAWQASENTNQQVKTDVWMVEMDVDTPAAEAGEMHKIPEAEHRPRRDELSIEARITENTKS